MTRLVYTAAAAAAAAAAFAWSAAVSSAPAGVVAAEPAGPRRLNISLTSFDVAPDVLRLKAGQLILLRVANDSSVSHDLTAPEFFAAAAIRPADSAKVTNGRISLGAHQNVVIAMVPSSGRYPAKCSHPFHKMMGMSATIFVDP